MAAPKWSFMFRMLKRNPDRVPMDRLGEYLRVFADLLGTENCPVFKGVKKASTGLRAYVPDDRIDSVQARLKLVHSPDDSRPARIAAQLEAMLGDDGIKEAQLVDAHGHVLRYFHGAVAANEELLRVWQEGSVDGTVTGLVGADDTMHLHMRALDGHDVKVVVRDEALARDVLTHFRNGLVRMVVKGHWVRGSVGWYPETNKCVLKSFEVLDQAPLSEVLREFAAVPDSGWQSLQRAEDYWRELRGLH